MKNIPGVQAPFNHVFWKHTGVFFVCLFVLLLLIYFNFISFASGLQTCQNCRAATTKIIFCCDSTDYSIFHPLSSIYCRGKQNYPTKVSIKMAFSAGRGYFWIEPVYRWVHHKPMTSLKWWNLIHDIKLCSLYAYI